MTPVTRDEFEALKAETARDRAEIERIASRASSLERRMEAVEVVAPAVVDHQKRLEMLETELVTLRADVRAVKTEVHSIGLAVDRLMSASSTQGLVMERVEKLLVSLVAHVRGPVND